MKRFINSLVPDSIHVPIKYIMNRWRNQLEPELELLPLLVRRGERSIDVGGNRGQYTYALWRIGSRVDVFEPNPMCSRLLKAWATNKTSVVVHAIGLSDNAGEAELHIPVDRFGNEHDASATLSADISTETRTVRVSLATLDSFTFANVAFVKIDVEGHEYNVLKGGEKLFKQQRPSILIEVEQRHSKRPMNEVFDLVRSWGYRGFFLQEETLLNLEEFNATTDQDLGNFAANSRSYINNFVFLHEALVSDGRYAELLSEWGCR
jgi:FkbM family methyltransferase